MKYIYKTLFIVAIICLAGIPLFCKAKEKPKKVALMWFDAEANFARFSNTDSID